MHLNECLETYIVCLLDELQSWSNKSLLNSDVGKWSSTLLVCQFCRKLAKCGSFWGSGDEGVLSG